MLQINILNLRVDDINQTICKHIAKAPRANTTAKALSKSLQSQRTERNCFKMPTLKK
jgi:hypothetical protein